MRCLQVDFEYQALSWRRPRRVIAKVERHPGELPPRLDFVVANLPMDPDRIIRFYNQRSTWGMSVNSVAACINLVTTLCCKREVRTTSMTPTQAVPHSEPKYVIVGNSHTGAINSWLNHNPDPQFIVWNEKTTPFHEPEFEWPVVNPDMLCLSIRGNEHNVFSLFEHPSPYDVGGNVQDDKMRVAIPSAVFEDVLLKKLSGITPMTEGIVKRFPDTRMAIICPPPPIEDFEKVVYFPEVLKEKLHLGRSPLSLRLAAYKVQARYYEDLAKKFGMEFLPPPTEAIAESGLLASRYSGGDPTHANRYYGGLVVDQIRALGSN
jgi:hypothetical protein